jgi:hypothetical protein
MESMMGETSMNRNQFGTHQPPYTLHGIQHREIGLRAVAAAILYQSGNAERTTSRELSAQPVSAMSPDDYEA